MNDAVQGEPIEAEKLSPIAVQAMPQVGNPLSSETALKFWCLQLVLGNEQVEGERADMQQIRREAERLYKWLTKDRG